MKKLIIDCFAGGGGASVGLEMCFGREVDYAINHDPMAILMHKTNHPKTVHFTEDVFSVNLKRYVANKTVGLMWASPDCTSHSKAKGGKPRESGLRILPWAVYNHVKDILPEVIIMENVEEIQQWGPLDEEGYPIKERMGEEYKKFISSMISLGYTFESKELIAADYGAPTSRKRWYAVFRNDGKPIKWPEKTHSKDGLGNLPKWISVSSVIDFSNIGKSINERKKPLAKKTLDRIDKGITKFPFVTKADYDSLIKSGVKSNIAAACDTTSQFMIEYYGCSIGQSLNLPLHTIVTKDRFALVTVLKDNAGNILDTFIRMLTPEELKLAQGFPKDYIIDRDYNWKTYPLNQRTKRIGNSVSPIMAEALTRANCSNLIERKRTPNINLQGQDTVGQLSFI